MPPLRAAVEIMAGGASGAAAAAAPEFRAMFDRDAILQSDWYAERLAAKADVDRRLWRRHADYVAAFAGNPLTGRLSDDLGLDARLAYAKRKLAEAESPDYAETLRGTTGVQPGLVAS